MKNYLSNDELDILISKLNKEQLNNLYKSITIERKINLFFDSLYQYILSIAAVGSELLVFYKIWSLFNYTSFSTSDKIMSWAALLAISISIEAYNYLENEKKDLKQEFCLKDLIIFRNYIKLNKEKFTASIEDIKDILKENNKELEKTI